MFSVRRGQRVGGPGQFVPGMGGAQSGFDGLLAKSKEIQINHNHRTWRVGTYPARRNPEQTMNGTVPQKIGRILTDLVLHPQYIPRCLNHNVINGKTPLDLEIPWFSYAAIDFLKTFLKPGMTVCEYGSGGSTLFFAKQVRSVFSIEDNPKWYELVTTRLKQKSVGNVTLKLCPFDFKNPAGFEHSEYLHAMPDERFDVIVVDGSEEWKQVRPVCFQKAEARVKPGGIIVVDDSWRYPGLREHNEAKRVKVFQSVGPCRPGVTSTDIFFY
jgi:precorrin-6B methylase 2